MTESLDYIGRSASIGSDAVHMHIILCSKSSQQREEYDGVGLQKYIQVQTEMFTQT